MSPRAADLVAARREPRAQLAEVVELAVEDGDDVAASRSRPAGRPCSRSITCEPPVAEHAAAEGLGRARGRGPGGRSRAFIASTSAGCGARGSANESPQIPHMRDSVPSRTLRRLLPRRAAARRRRLAALRRAPAPPARRLRRDRADAAARRAYGEDEERWLERARAAAAHGPFGHHTHWTSPTHARPTGGDPARARPRARARWLRAARARAPLLLRRRLVHGRGVAAASPSSATSTAPRPPSGRTTCPPGAPRLALAAPALAAPARRRRCCSSCRRPTRSACRARGAPRAAVPDVVHVLLPRHGSARPPPRVALRGPLLVLAAPAPGDRPRRARRRRRRPTRRSCAWSDRAWLIDGPWLDWPLCPRSRPPRRSGDRVPGRAAGRGHPRGRPYCPRHGAAATALRRVVSIVSLSRSTSVGLRSASTSRSWSASCCSTPTAAALGPPLGRGRGELAAVPRR